MTENFKWEYAPAPESRAQVRFKNRYGLFINGQFVAPRSGKYSASTNPATGELLAKVALANAKDVDLAVAAAKKAYEKVWKKTPAKDRAKYLFRISRIMQERAKELAITESLDSGKTIREARDFDIPKAAAHFFYYAGWADKLEYAFPGRKAESIGVAGQIIPWNFPLLMAAWKIAPALACGNTVVLKPAETTPLTALLLAEIIQESGLPPGVVNILTGDAATGQAIVQHGNISKIAFTGSSLAGKWIQKTLAGSDKKLTLELGGKSANIILDDAPIDQAVEGVVNGIFFNQGQVCCAGSRLLLQENIADEVIAKLKFRMSRLIVGDPLDKNTDIGAINNQKQFDKIQACLGAAKNNGLQIYETEGTVPRRGLFCKPSLVMYPGQNDPIVQEEIFGPVLAVQTFRTVNEAIEKANNTAYGLSAGVWSDKGSRALALCEKLKAGVIWCNTFNQFDPSSPFGGYKESGFGREGGVQGLAAYLKLH